ncbi:MAG: peptide/nickel transport system permease protein [Myxococcota bacterium]|jgi:peptide/nickel transport system permease protein
MLRVWGRWSATVIGVAALLLLLVDAAPGDAIDLLPDGESLRPELERRWHLDRSLPERLFRWLSGVATGDLGTSWVVRPGATVQEVLAGPATQSMVRLAAAIALSMTAGVVLAWGRPEGRTWARAPLSIVSLAPVFLLAHLAVAGLNAAAWYAMEAGWIPRPDWFALPTEPSWLRGALAVTVLAVGSGALSGLVADIDDALARLHQAPFVRAARARGEPTGRMLSRHLIPTLAALVSDRIAFFIGGLVILEKVLLLGGAGALLWRASLERDVELVLSIGLGAGILVATGRLVSDLVRAWVDPRLTAIGADP